MLMFLSVLIASCKNVDVLRCSFCTFFRELFLQNILVFAGLSACPFRIGMQQICIQYLSVTALPFNFLPSVFAHTFFFY